MYFPDGFDRGLSIELGELVQQAYVQYEAFERDESWSLPGRYLLNAELSYAWTAGKTFETGRRNFDTVLRAAGRLKNRRTAEIPLGYVAKRLSRAYVVFRGTLTTTEWIRNFGIGLSPYLLPGYGRVHDGFLQSYKLLRSKILDAIDGLDRKTLLFVAGHSLGAALATLSVPDIEANSKLKVQYAYLYGSPRVGDAAFAKAYNNEFAKRSFRIVNTSDIVTSLPLPVPIAGRVGGYFSHVDTPIDMTIQKNDLEENHQMKTYLSALREEKQRRNFLTKMLKKNA